jgi:hypothetical protein
LDHTPLAALIVAVRNTELMRPLCGAVKPWDFPTAKTQQKRKAVATRPAWLDFVNTVNIAKESNGRTNYQTGILTGVDR